MTTRADMDALAAIEAGLEIPTPTLLRLIDRKLVRRSKWYTVSRDCRIYSWWVTPAGIKVIQAMRLDRTRVSKSKKARKR